jgi:hypothetical protein
MMEIGEPRYVPSEGGGIIYKAKIPCRKRKKKRFPEEKK